MIPATLTPDLVRADIEKTTKALEQAAGVRPRGWISPRGTPSKETARFLLEEGYVYVQTFDKGKLVAIPLTMRISSSTL